MKKRILPAFVFLITLFLSVSVYGATYTSRANGAWTTTTTWTPTAPTGGPTAADDVVIIHNVTWAGGNWTGSGSITIQTTGSLSGTLTISGATALNGTNTSNKMDLTVSGSGSLVLNNSLTLKDHSVFTMTAGTASVVSMSVEGGSYVGNGGTLTITTNGLTINSSGGSSFTNNAGGTVIVNTGSSVGDVDAAKFTNAGSFSVVNTGGDFVFANSGGTFSNTGTLTVGGNFQANASITNAGTITTGTFTVPNTGGTFTNTGNMTVTGLTDILGGTVQLSPSTTPAANSRLTVRGIFRVSGWGTINVGNGPRSTPAYYADLVIEANLGQLAGTLNVKCNGRVAVFSDFNISAGAFNIENCGTGNGGQVYVDGDGSGASVTRTGGNITNNNGAVGGVPYGFYVNGTTSGTVPAAGTVSQMQTSNPGFYSWIASLPNSPLPVKLVYFKVSGVNENGISLEWATSMEKDFSHFELQRASSDLNFSAIGIEEGRGSLQVKTVYSFLDNSPVNGKNYYRLKAVDVDGSAEYFNVIVAEWSGSLGLSLYPNPAVNKSFTIDVGDEFDQPVGFVVYEARGIAIYSATLDVRTKVVELPAGTAPGVYLVKVGSSGKSKIVRLVVD